MPRNVLDNNGNITSTSTVVGAAPDAAAAMLPNGRILCALSGTLYNDPRSGTNISAYWMRQTNPLFPAPVSFFEYNPGWISITMEWNGVHSRRRIRLSMPASTPLHYFQERARTIHIKGPGSSAELFSTPISIPVTMISTGGSATVGQ